MAENDKEHEELKAQFDLGCEIMEHDAMTSELWEALSQPGGVERAIAAMKREFFGDAALYFRVRGINYRIPSMDALRRAFPTAVDLGYEHAAILSTSTSSCQHVSRETRDAVFGYVLAKQENHPSGYVATGAMVDRIDELGLRPALAEELIAFGMAFPGEIARGPIAALGSTIFGDGTVSFAFLAPQEGRKTYLGLSSTGGRWRADTRFLVTAKNA